ncbi:hypothetical protein JCM10213_000903 [Rhodosporidiobolus nylandii]
MPPFSVILPPYHAVPHDAAPAPVKLLETTAERVEREKAAVEQLERQMPDEDEDRHHGAHILQSKGTYPEARRSELMQDMLLALEKNRTRLLAYELLARKMKSHRPMTNAINDEIARTTAFLKRHEAQYGQPHEDTDHLDDEAFRDNNNHEAFVYTLKQRLETLAELGRVAERCLAEGRFSEYLEKYNIPEPSAPIGVHTDSEDESSQPRTKRARRV